MRSRLSLAVLAATVSLSTPAGAATLTSLGFARAGGDAGVLYYQRVGDGNDGAVKILALVGGAWTTETTTEPDGCYPSEAGAGKVVFDCPYDYQEHGPVPAVKPWLFDVATQQVAKARGADGLASYEDMQDVDDDVYTSGIGTRLLAARLVLNETERTLLLDPVRKRFFYAPAQTSHTAPSLDVPSGRVPLCAPLRRPMVPLEDGYGRVHRAPQPVTYVPPYMAYSTPSAFDHPRTRSVVLQRCGSSKRTVLSHNYAPILLSKRYVAWSRRGLHLRFLASGRQYVFRLPHSCDEILGGGRFIVCYTTGGSSSLIDLADQPVAQR